MATTKAAKVKKKKWYTIISDSTFNNSYLGELPTAEPSTLVGRPIVVNLMELMRDPKKQHMNLRFRITSVQGENAVAEIHSIEESPSFVKRIVRRRRDKLDNSFLCKTADSKVIRIKPLILTASNTKSSIRTVLQNAAKDLIIKSVRKVNFDTLVRDIVVYKFQHYLNDRLRKIYPLKTCEIRYVGLAPGAKFKEAEEGIIEQSDYTKENIAKEEAAEKEEVLEKSEETLVDAGS